MTKVLRAPARTAVWCAAAALGALALATSAFAAPSPPTNLTVTPASPTDATSVTVTFGASTPDDLSTITGYEGGLAGGPLSPISSGDSIATPDAGQFTVEVQAVEDGVVRSAPATVPLIIDRAPPVIAVSLVGTLTNNWYRALSIHFTTCTDDAGLPAGACNDRPWTQAGTFPPQSVSVTDVAGRIATTATPAFNFDASKPTKPSLTGPGPLVPDQPTFTWRPSVDAANGSGLDRYVVQWQPDDSFDPSGWTALATVDDTGGIGDYSLTPSGYAATPLPENTLIDWRVVAYDLAGNFQLSSGTGQKVTIDPTVPPAPVITGGPVAPTQEKSPTFTWDGAGATFRWSVTPVESQNPLRGGAGPDKQVTVASLPDGAYVFHVTQFTPANRESAEATRSFVVDTTPPEPPAILTRPTFPSVVTPVFTWSTEPGAYSRWSVLGGGGATIAGPVDTPVTSAELPALADGAYSFQVQQIDAAGNVSSATVEPFTVIAPLVPAPATGPGGTITILPKQFARRLQPKAGKLVTSRQPMLSWSRGPRGTKLFNLQIFRVTSLRSKGTPRVIKVLSVFPKRRAYRVPRNKTLPKTCYVWRVWPYTGSAFTPKPLGVSNYCVASARVITKKAQIIAARKAARIRSARR